MGRFRLRQGSHELELPPGDFFIGRSPECQLTLDDPLVSRRHAVIHVVGQQAVLEDLGSRNGVLVNGERARGNTPMRPGDRMVIGSQELTLVLVTPSQRPTEAGFTQPMIVKAEPARTAPSLKAVADAEPEFEPETRRASAFTLLLGVAGKALALGKLDDAERILANLVADWEKQLQTSRPSEPIEGLDDAAQLAIQLATATSKSDWVDWVFNAYTGARRVLPAPLIDELHAFVRRNRYPAGLPIRSYVDALRNQEPTLRPAERFLLKRIEGLLDVAAAN
jgi:predicted component of type VI protein secretion system